jgi:hypothetical protein
MKWHGETYNQISAGFFVLFKQQGHTEEII